MRGNPLHSWTHEERKSYQEVSKGFEQYDTGPERGKICPALQITEYFYYLLDGFAGAAFFGAGFSASSGDISFPLLST
jgi:hypothetical protein